MSFAPSFSCSVLWCKVAESDDVPYLVTICLILVWFFLHIFYDINSLWVVSVHYITPFPFGISPDIGWPQNVRVCCNYSCTRIRDPIINYPTVKTMIQAWRPFLQLISNLNYVPQGKASFGSFCQRQVLLVSRPFVPLCSKRGFMFLFIEAMHCCTLFLFLLHDDPSSGGIYEWSKKKPCHDRYILKALRRYGLGNRKAAIRKEYDQI